MITTTREEVEKTLKHLKNRIEKLHIGSNGCLIADKHDLKNLVDDSFRKLLTKGSF